MKPASIRRRLTGTVFGVLLLFAGGGVAAVYTLFRLALIRQFNGTLLTKAQAISTLVVASGAEVRINFSDRFMRGFDSEVGTDFFELWRADGTAIAHSETLGGRELPRLVGEPKKPLFWSLTLPNGRSGTAVGMTFVPSRGPPRFRDESEPVNPRPVLNLVVATDRQELDELLERLAMISGLAIVLLAGATLSIPPVLRWSLRPLERLAEQTRSVDASSLSTRLPADRLPAELQPIARCLNELFERLERSFERERRVSADLAHELRTPLAELRTWTECALKWPEKRDPATDREILAATEHMEAVVIQMLTLARSELGKLPVAAEPVNLAATVATAWRPFAARAQSKNLEVRLDLRPASSVTDPDLLRSILTNLFDNAVEYTPAGGTVEIGCAAAAGGAEICVGNSTANFTSEDLGRLFERFWRKEEARSGGSHVGLGLAISQAFAQALGWQMTAALNSERRLTIVLSTPRAARGD